MQIILLERVEKLGTIGDVVTVKPGYARNFLLPNGKALRASKANLEKFEADRAEIEARNADMRSAAEAQAGQMGDLTISLVRAASEMGQLFGSVTARDIANGVSEAGHQVDKRHIVMDKAIKSLGLFPIKVNLHAEVALTVTVNIARSLEEAQTQLELGRAVISSENDFDDEDEAPAAEAASEDEAPAEEAADDADAETAEVASA
jgi:large subunit ribosomal protein L9